MGTTRDWTTGSLSSRFVDTEEGIVEINGVQGFLLPLDLKILTYYASRLPVNAQIVEIGSFLGLSALIMAKALYASHKYGAKIHCIDTWEGSIEHQSMEIVAKGKLFDKFKENIYESGLSGYVAPIKTDSVTASRGFPDQSFDLIFIDGDHSFEGSFADLRAWYPKLKPGGVFLGHDGKQGVRSAIEHFLSGQDLCSTLFGVPPQSGYMYKIDPLQSVLKMQ